MDKAQIDEQGYRRGVAIIILNDHNQVLWARRCEPANAWQFPQGGIHVGEDLQQALYRELMEEVGLSPTQVNIMAESKEWLTYTLPVGKQSVEGQTAIGQRQKWFLLRLLVGDEKINLRTTLKPEFDAWRWINYWDPLKHIVFFKREVYKQALTEFADYLVNPNKK